MSNHPRCDMPQVEAHDMLAQFFGCAHLSRPLFSSRTRGVPSASALAMHLQDKLQDILSQVTNDREHHAVAHQAKRLVDVDRQLVAIRQALRPLEETGAATAP